MLTFNQEIVSSIAGGFAGAFFALIFLGISSFIAKILTRKVIHYNSLIILETQLNEMIGIIKDNAYLMPPFREAIKNGNIYWSRIRVIPVDKSHLNKLADLDLINDLFEFDYKVRKVNDDIENLTTGYNELKDAYIHKYINVEHYIINAKITAEQIELLEIFSDDILEDLIKLLVKVRILIEKDKPILTKIQEKLNKASGDKITVNEFKKERTKMEKELEESSRKSKEQIDRLVNKKKNEEIYI